MKFKGFWYDGLLISVTAGIAAVFVAMTFFVEKRLAAAECLAFALVFVVALYRAISAKSRYKKFLIKTAKKLDYTDRKVLSAAPFPVVVCDDAGVITWCSEKFLNEIAKGEITTEQEVYESMKARDLQDSTREIAPAVPAEDAIFLDNSGDFDTVIETALRIIREKTTH